MVLLNMVMDEDLETDEDYNELVDEVRGECEKYGKLVTLVIPRAQVTAPLHLMFTTSISFEWMFIV